MSVILFSRRDIGRTFGSKPSLRRWPAVILTMMCFVGLGIILWKPLPILLPPNTERLLNWCGFIIYFPAILHYFWGLLTIGRFFGVSSANGADLYSGHQLIMNGPFEFVRHPMYLAVILAAIGGFLFFLTWAMLIFFPMSLIVILRASREEKILEAEFGSQWIDYAEQVPKWFPRIMRNNQK